MSVREFIQRHYRHFNAGSVRDAADGYVRHLEGGGNMLVTLAGAKAVGVVSSDEKGEYAKSLGAVGCIDRTAFGHWGVPPAWDSPEWKTWFEGAKAFVALCDGLAAKHGPRFEPPPLLRLLYCFSLPNFNSS